MEEVIAKYKEDLSPSFLMTKLDKSITNTLNKNNLDLTTSFYQEKIIKDYNSSESVSIINDGLDIAICFIDKKSKELTFSGAGLSLYRIQGDDVNEIRQRENKGLGGLFCFDKKFNETKVQLNDDDLIVLTTDGIIDQFGGERGKKLLKKRFKEMIKIIGEDSLESSLKWEFFLSGWLNGYGFEEIKTDFINNSISLGNINSLKYNNQVDDITIVSFKI